jgi:phage tail sheath protein FI
MEDAAVNLLRQEARGFLCLSASTLSGGDLQPIGVRRLLSLLRRVALAHGPTYVFEPDDEGLRRRVAHSFETLLGRMFSLGAFAGRVPEEAFQVIVHPVTAQRPPGSGRLVVELRVAPSHPLRFLSVRLVQAGDRSLRVEGI